MSCFAPTAPAEGSEITFGVHIQVGMDSSPSSKDALLSVIRNPHSSQYKSFISFLKAQHCLENLLFYLACDKFKEHFDSSKDRLALSVEARSICNTFVVCAIGSVGGGYDSR